MYFSFRGLLVFAMEKEAQKKSRTAHFLSLFGKLAVVLLSFFINNLLGLSLHIKNLFNRNSESRVRVCREDEKQSESRSSKNKEAQRRMKRKSRIEAERSLPPSDGSDDVVCREDLHDASVEKRRKTAKSRESDTLGNEIKEKGRKRKSNSRTKNEQTRKEKPRKKDWKREGDLLDASVQKKMKPSKSEELGAMFPKTENKKMTKEPKNEARSLRRKREDMDAADKDCRASENNNPRVKPGTVPTKKWGKHHRNEEIADMVSQKQGFDDEDKLHRTVFVRNLSLETKKHHLLREFSQFGEVESVRLRLVVIAESKVPQKNGVLMKKINDAIGRSYAYIVFKNEQSANAALSHNMTQFSGDHIHVERAQPPSKKLRGKNHFMYDVK